MTKAEIFAWSNAGRKIFFSDIGCSDCNYSLWDKLNELYFFPEYSIVRRKRCGLCLYFTFFFYKF